MERRITWGGVKGRMLIKEGSKQASKHPEEMKGSSGGGRGCIGGNRF